jgi:hypothetical protein
MDGAHMIAYVRASNYLKKNVNIPSAIYDKVHNLWFEMGDKMMDIVLQHLLTTKQFLLSFFYKF